VQAVVLCFHFQLFVYSEERGYSFLEEIGACLLHEVAFRKTVMFIFRIFFCLIYYDLYYKRRPYSASPLEVNGLFQKYQ
jgi:hypothetical protein